MLAVTRLLALAQVRRFSHFMRGGGLPTLAASARDGAARVEISDTGTGKPPEVRGETFEADDSTKRRGTGMGLALTEKWIGQDGRRLDFRSGRRGATFRIATPLESPVVSDGPN